VAQHLNSALALAALTIGAVQGYTGLYENQKDMFVFDDNAMQTIEFVRNKKGEIEKLTTTKLDGNEIWNKTNKLLPNENGMKVDEKILETYVGEYELPSVFTFAATKEQDRLFIQAAGQEKLEMLAESETKFFLKVNDAQFEFTTGDSGSVTKVMMNQGGREAEAKRIK